MRPARPHPLLYQVNTRAHLSEVAQRLARSATLDDISTAFLEQLARDGFDWLWLLGLWQTGPASRRVSLSDPGLRVSAAATLPDLSDADIVGSPFAVAGYVVRPEWGGNDALARLRQRAAASGLRLMLDFVPNHTGLDHPWLEEHPEYYVHGSPDDLARAPQSYVRVRSRGRDLVLAYGRDPYFPGWADTLQLDYRHAGLREAMRQELLRIGQRCDGVRCDMAMLVQPDVFAKTWPGGPADGSSPVHEPFWREAIARVRRDTPRFTFLAEVYWGREWELQEEGFDYTYDKELYDRLRSGDGRRVREHLRAEPLYQRRSARFLENHDEPRAAATFPDEVQRAAAVIAFFAPGLRFFHEGQLEGRRVQTSLHVRRRPAEPPDEKLQSFYARLLGCLERPEVHTGEWSLRVCRPAWEGNESFRDLIVMAWVEAERRLVLAVNYSPHPSQCYVTLDLPGVAGRRFALIDRLGGARYSRDGDALAGDGLYLDMPAWGHHAFELEPR